MPKSVDWKIKISPKNLAWWTGCLLLGYAPVLRAADGGAVPFVGSVGCSSSSCHGGGGTTQSEYTQWVARDFHHERPVATLSTARAARIADNLKISDPTRDARCTACHAPLQTIPAELLSADNKITEGVSCENCHAPAGNWLRSHTRKDFTTADRVQTGMRDLKNLYVRANTCVACHQNVDRDLRLKGHPELVFELDGQCATEPRHWSKEKDKPGPQIWLVGQAVALREISWQLSGETQDPEKTLHDQCVGLLHVFQGLAKSDRHLPAFNASFLEANASDWAAVQHWSDDLAKAAADMAWTDSLTHQCLTALAGTAETFNDPAFSPSAQARYAERLTLALDRLTVNSPSLADNAKLNKSLNRLYADVQNLVDFEPLRFVKDLNNYRDTLAAVSP